MHWGTWQVQARDGNIEAVTPVPWDKNPSRIGQSLPDAVTSKTRIRRPAVRATCKMARLRARGAVKSRLLR